MVFFLSAVVTAVNSDVVSSGGGFSATSIDVRYVSDGVEEKNVALSRVKTARDNRSSVLFLRSLLDLCNRIALITPRRQDIRKKLFEGVDFALIDQMIFSKAFGFKEAVSIFQHVFSFILALEDPDRQLSDSQWMEEFYSKCQAGKSQDLNVYVIPVFFEFCNSCVDEINRELSNYYISTLSSVLQRCGHSQDFKVYSIAVKACLKCTVPLGLHLPGSLPSCLLLVGNKL